MAQHKAPTSITIAPVSEKSGLALFVERYWKVALIAAFVLVGALLYRQSARANAEQLDLEAWEKLSASMTPDPRTGVPSGRVEELVAISSQVKETQAAPYALFYAAIAAARDRKYDEAKSLVARVRTEFPTSPLVTHKVATTAGAPKLSEVEQLEARIQAQVGWRAQHPALFGLPELPADAPKVRINTDRGSIVVGLYPQQSPLHAENFLKLAREGSFNGLKFHRVVANRAIQSGDPNTLQEDVANWGAGEIGTTQAPEPSELRHFAGALSSAHVTGSMASSGSQFQILLADDFSQDATTFVFGRVVEGLDIAKAISESPTVVGTERPEQPTTIQSTEVL